jgi:phosphate transport system substrate-binding protein
MIAKRMWLGGTAFPPLSPVLAVLIALCLGLGSTQPAQAQSKVEVDPKIPDYKATDGVSGSLKSVGSDTMNNLMALWGENFRKLYPSVQVEIEGKGSGTAPPALISGSGQFGPMSREMKQAEIDKFEEKFGYKPTKLPTSIDMLAVYVHKDNPIKNMTLQQVDAIFSKTRKGGEKEIKTWGDLGLTDDWADKPISLYGRNSVSGTYTFFKEHVLLNGDFSDSVKEQAGSAAVVQAVASDKYAIGYSGIGYKTADVRAVPLAKSGKSAPVEALPENAYSGKYPLARALYVYVNYKPRSELDPLRREFIKYVFSKEGQTDVIKDGYFPVPASVAAKALKSVGIEP